MNLVKLLITFLFIFILNCPKIDGRSTNLIHTDAGFSNEYDEPLALTSSNEADESNPGWLRRQLQRFGKWTGATDVTNGEDIGSRIGATIDKLCKTIKGIIPIVRVVCNVRNFEFCGRANINKENADIELPNYLE